LFCIHLDTNPTHSLNTTCPPLHRPRSQPPTLAITTSTHHAPRLLTAASMAHCAGPWQLTRCSSGDGSLAIVKCACDLPDHQLVLDTYAIAAHRTPNGGRGPIHQPNTSLTDVITATFFRRVWALCPCGSASLTPSHTSPHSTSFAGRIPYPVRTECVAFMPTQEPIQSHRDTPHPSVTFASAPILAYLGWPAGKGGVPCEATLMLDALLPSTQCHTRRGAPVPSR
jgi:hypothetical protein